MNSTITAPPELDGPLAVRMLDYIDRAMIPFVRKYPGLADEMRSRAQLDLVRAEPKAAATDNPVGYLLITITNALRQVERKHLRERKRWRPQSLDAMVDASFMPPSFLPDPATVAMFREELALRDLPPPVPRSHNIQAHEWSIFKAVVAAHPDWRNRRIAEEVNRKMGRKLNEYKVSLHRRRFGI
jgi:hypothetical protein